MNDLDATLERIRQQPYRYAPPSVPPRCYGCGAYPRVNDLPLPWDQDQFDRWLTQSGGRFDR